MDLVHQVIPLGFTFIFGLILLKSWRFALAIVVLTVAVCSVMAYEAWSIEDGSGNSLDYIMTRDVPIDPVIYGVICGGFVTIGIVQLLTNRRRPRAPKSVALARTPVKARVALGEWLTDKEEAARYAPSPPAEGDAPRS